MAKVDRLDWMSGFIVRVMGERFGVRCNSEDALSAAVIVAKKQGWEFDSSQEPVTFLYSLRLAPKSEQRGRRNYNLLYLLSKRVSRTLERAELLQDFQKSVWAMAAVASQDRVLVQGTATKTTEDCIVTLVPLGHGSAEQPSEITSSYLEFDQQGRLMSDGETSKISEFRVPQTDSRKAGKPLTPGELSLYLLQASVTPAPRFLPVATKLAQRIPAISCGPNRLKNSSLRDISDQTKMEV